MRIYPAAIAAAYAAATKDGLITRKAVWITGRDRETGLPVERGIWAGSENAPLTVLRGVDGAQVTRPYYGGGEYLKVGEIPLTSDMTLQTVTVDLSQLADVAREIVRTHDIHRGGIEIHEIVLSPSTGAPIGADFPIFNGIIDGAPIKNPAVGGEGSVKLKCVSEMMAMLSRTNTEKSSHEAQMRRGGDELNIYANTVQTWNLPWGMKS